MIFNLKSYKKAIKFESAGFKIEEFEKFSELFNEMMKKFNLKSAEIFF